MLITVGITVYNHSRFIRESLDSILSAIKSERRFLYQVLIHDDFSTDDSFDNVLNFLAHNGLDWELLRAPRNLGVAGSVNTLLDAARGEYICLCSGDDLVLQDKFSVLYPVLSLKKYNVISHNNKVLIEDKSNTITAVDNVNHTHTLSVESVLDNPVPLPGISFKVTDLRFRDEVLVSNDFDFLLRNLAIGGGKHISSRLGIYRIHSDNLSRKKDYQSDVIFQDGLRIYMKLSSFSHVKDTSHRLLLKVLVNELLRERKWFLLLINLPFHYCALLFQRVFRKLLKQIRF